jgi:hypothetical protein
MKSRTYLAYVSAVMMALSVFRVQAQQQSKKMTSDMAGMADEQMNKRGDHVMGFDHTKTTHHFRLLPQGGTIEITANSAEDTESRDQIRSHLGHISKMFAEGNFNAPMLIHEQTPPGVPVMQKLKSEIEYRFEETERGASIHISTANSKALLAIYKFLRFQIKEHKTGDSLEVTQRVSL